ncbi:MAG: GNAT family N-acetyltransferase [Candidatus Marithrix sp.]
MKIIQQITSINTNYWQQFIDIYYQTFPNWEREAIDIIAKQIQNGNYLLFVGIDNKVVGFYILDIVTELNYAVLTYLAVIESKRNQGYGISLCKDAINRCKMDLLLVETEYPNLYRKIGFKKFNFAYQIPKFTTSDSVIMYLLAIHNNEPNNIYRSNLVKIITHMFINGYQLTPNDNRIYKQILQIPDQVELIDL